MWSSERIYPTIWLMDYSLIAQSIVDRRQMNGLGFLVLVNGERNSGSLIIAHPRFHFTTQARHMQGAIRI